jgi:S-DNA-T family DNA segregation ATPase FtsK/SpoIIIE
MTARSSSKNLHAYEDRHPMQKMAGYSLCLLAFYLLVCLLSYNQADPSFNRASADAVSNAGGYSGALIADVVLQTMGFASALLVLVPMAWGVKVVRGHPVPFMWMRFSMLLVSLVLSASLLSLMEPPLSWPIVSGLGGSIGVLLHDSLHGLFKLKLFVFSLFTVTMVMISLAFGMASSEWISLGRMARNAFLMVVGAVVTFIPKGQYGRSLVASDDDYEDEERLPLWKRAALGLAEKLLFWQKYESDEDEEETLTDEEEGDEEYRAPKPEPRVAKKIFDKSMDKSANQPKAQAALPLGDYEMPPMKLLTAAPKSKKPNMSEAALTQNAKLLESVLQDFGVNGDIVEIRPGPVVTLYELEPAAGTKSSRVIGLADDIARSMSAVSTRIAVIPGRNAIGIEMPNQTRETIFLKPRKQSCRWRWARISAGLPSSWTWRGCRTCWWRARRGRASLWRSTP